MWRRQRTNLALAAGIALIGPVSNAPAQAGGLGDCANPLPEWTVKLSKSGGSATVREAAVDSAGNVFVVGHFGGTQDFDPGEGVDLHVSTVGPDSFYSYDGFVSKYGPDGSYLWTRTVGGAGDDYGEGVSTDEGEKVYLAGGFSGTVDFDPSDGIDERTAAGEVSPFLLGLTEEGDYAGVITFGEGPDRSFATGVALDVAGNIVVLGYFSGTVDFDPGEGEDIRVGAADVFVTKFTSEGAYLWTRAFGSPAFDAGYALVVDVDGSIFAGGEFRGAVDFDPDGLGDVHTTVGPSGTFVTKRRGDGGYEWTRVWQIAPGGVGVSLAVDLDGSVYTAGAFQGSVDFDPTEEGVDVHRVQVGTSADVFVTKVYGDGSYARTATFGGPGSDLGYSVAVASDRGVFVTGSFGETCDFDPGESQDLYTTMGLQDFFLTSLHADGSYAWTRTFGGVGNDKGKRIVLGTDATATVVGSFRETVDFDPGCGLDVHANVSGMGESFVTRFSCVESTADIDSDGDVDLRDFAAFQRCFTGEAPTTCHDGCQLFDLDPDDDIDLADYAEFLVAAHGP